MPSRLIRTSALADVSDTGTVYRRMEETTPMDQWSLYFKRKAEAQYPLEPSATLVAALKAFVREDFTGLALDLGSGTGGETMHLLRSGWNVIALDHHPEAIASLQANAPAGSEERLTPVQQKFECFQAAQVPALDLINASHSLPFCPPQYFPAFWQEIKASLRSGGRFCGHFFGIRDDWRHASGLTFQSRDDLDQLLTGFTPELVEEHEHDARSVAGPIKHWHIFSVVARRC